MLTFAISRYAFSVSVASALLAGCGALPQAPNGMQSAASVRMPEARVAAKYGVLYSFKGAPNDGSTPLTALLDANGTFYGTTLEGGAYNDGTIFSITASGNEKLLYSFKGYGSGGHTRSGPSNLINVDGTLYGTTFAGGAHGAGSVFTVTTSGKMKVLYSFNGCSDDDGGGPSGRLLDVNGVLYGTTSWGGNTCASSPQFGGCGTVFSITPSGKQTVLYSFKCYPDAAHPGAGLGSGGRTASGSGLVSAGGVLYGTSPYGGAKRDGSECERGDGEAGCGAVFAVTTSGSERVIYSFGGRHGGVSDGVHPVAGLVETGDRLYGETPMGGSDDWGTVFALATSGKERVLHSFGAPRDGEAPVGGLADINGTLYGVTRYGGERGGQGTLFSITASGDETVLHRFDLRGARNPDAGLISANGTLYGTAQGGVDHQGVVLDLTP